MGSEMCIRDSSNHAPEAVKDRIVVDEGGTITSLHSGEAHVTGNDIDLDTTTSALRVHIIDPVKNGTLQLNADGSFLYQHDGSETVSDHFSYRVVDPDPDLPDSLIRAVSDELAGANKDIGLVEIEIVPVNDRPLAGTIEDQITAVNQEINFSLPEDLFTDQDADDILSLAATLEDGSPLPQWLEFNPESARFSGTPDTTSIGNLKIRVTATDNADASAAAHFSLEVEPAFEAAFSLPPIQQSQTPTADAAQLLPTPGSTATSAAAAQQAERETTVSNQANTREPDNAAAMSRGTDDTNTTKDQQDQSRTDTVTDLFSAVSADNSSDYAQKFEDKVVQFQLRSTTTKSEPVAAAAIAVPADTVALDKLFFLPGDFTPDSIKSIARQLDQNQSQLTQLAEQPRMAAGTAITVTSSLTIGYVIWLVRGGLLLSSVLSSMPAWRWIDPVPVLTTMTGDDAQGASESLQSMVDEDPDQAAQNTHPDADHNAQTKP